jgi:hypothetical protein
MESIAIHGLSPRPDVACRAAGDADNTDQCPECSFGGFDGYCQACGATRVNGATLNEGGTQALTMMRASHVIAAVRTLEATADAAHRAGSWLPGGAVSYRDYRLLAAAQDQRSNRDR